MNKKTIIIFVAIIFLVCVGVYFVATNPVDESIPELTDMFDYSIEPSTSWNQQSKEYKFIQDISTMDNSDYENITFKITFYKNNNLLNTSYIDVNATENGKLKLNFTAKLSEEPDEFYYDLVNATKV